MGTRHGSIMATIITTHVTMNEAAAPTQVCPGILIHAIDLVQPPGIAMPPDMETHPWIVPAALATNRSALVPRNALSPARPGSSVRVSIVMPDPGLRELQTVLVSPFGNQVEVVIGAVQHVDPAGIGRVGMEDRAPRVLVEDAEPLAVRAVHRRLRIVVEDCAAPDLFRRESHVIVVVEAVPG